METSIEVFERTYREMEPGQLLQIVGGEFPGPDETAQMAIALQSFYPLGSVATGNWVSGRLDNPRNLEGDPDHITVTFERKLAWFALDERYGPVMAYAARAAQIGECLLDVWARSGIKQHSQYFIGKPAERGE